MHCSHMPNFSLASLLRPGRIDLRQERFAFYTVNGYTNGHNGYEVISSTAGGNSNEVPHALMRRLGTAL
jgi:hypothetical protein